MLTGATSVGTSSIVAGSQNSGGWASGITSFFNGLGSVAGAIGSNYNTVKNQFDPPEPGPGVPTGSTSTVITGGASQSTKSNDSVGLLFIGGFAVLVTVAIVALIKK